MQGDSKVYRPDSFESFRGQARAKENLRVAVVSAIRRNAPVPHILLAGPSGLGKTTLAKIVAKERNVDLSEVNAVAIDKPADLVAPLLQVETNGILFIDEIHALKRECEEYLYTAMEDRMITIPVGDGKEPVTTSLAPFTLMGATTREGLLTKPMLDRFVVREKLEVYTDEEMVDVVAWTIQQFENTGDVTFDAKIASVLSPFCHGVARAAQRFLVALRDHTLAHSDMSIVCPEVTLEFFANTVKQLGYRPDGLGLGEYRYLQALRETNKPQGIGVAHIAKVLDEDIRTVEDVIEPWLLRKGYVLRTTTGRVITPAGSKVL